MSEFVSKRSDPSPVQITVYRSSVLGHLPTNLGQLTFNFDCSHNHESRESAETCQRKIERTFENAARIVMQLWGHDLPERDVPVTFADGVQLVHCQAGRIVCDEDFNNVSTFIRDDMLSAGFTG